VSSFTVGRERSESDCLRSGSLGSAGSYLTADVGAVIENDFHFGHWSILPRIQLRHAGSCFASLTVDEAYALALICKRMIWDDFAKLSANRSDHEDVDRATHKLGAQGMRCDRCQPIRR
jgi:hypothetical protein